MKPMNFLPSAFRLPDGQTVQTLRWLAEGQNGRVALINDIYIFKYPKFDGANQGIPREAEALRRLQGLLPLDIPRPWEASGLPAGALCYERLEGRLLNSEALQGLPPVRRAAVTSQLGGFLRALHGLPCGLLEGLELPPADTARHWQEFYQKVSTLLFPHFRADAIEPVRWSFVRHLNRNTNFNVSPVVLHGDFGPGNLLCDDEGTVRVLDSGSVRLGDPAADIASLMGPMGYGEAFVRELAPHYPGLEDMLERARFYAQTFALQEALFGLENGDQDAYEDGMRKYI